MRNFFVAVAALLIVFSLTVSCGHSDPDGDNTPEDNFKIKVDSIAAKDSTNPDGAVDEDVRIISDTQVLFFMPSPAERRELINYYGAYNQYEYQTIFNSFIDLSKTVKSGLSGRGIKVEVTYAKKFIFPTEQDTIVYDLTLEDQVLGFIIADGINPPIIRNGVQSTRDVSNDLRNYFNLKNFSLYGDNDIEENIENDDVGNDDTGD